jgi:hypothetical protein
MTFAAQLTLSSPLNALVWVFGIAGGASLALTLTSAALAWNHRRQRNRRTTSWGADETVVLLSNFLTTGDLVMDSRLHSAASEMARVIREELRDRGSQPPEPPPERFRPQP